MQSQTKPKLIFVYTRAEAIRDGELVDISDKASENISIPVAMTRASFDKKQLLGIPTHEVVHSLCVAVMLTEPIIEKKSRWYRFTIGDERFKAWRGPGDDGKQCFTIMLAGES